MNTGKAKTGKVALIRKVLHIEYQNTDAQDGTDWRENSPKSVDPGNPCSKHTDEKRLIEYNLSPIGVAKQ